MNRKIKLLALLLFVVVVISIAFPRNDQAKSAELSVKQISVQEKESLVLSKPQEAPGGAIYSQKPWYPEIFTLCKDTEVRGGPREEASVIYILPNGSFVIPREIYNEWWMIQPAHWIKNPIVFDKCMR